MIKREGNIIYEITTTNTVFARYKEPWERKMCREIMNTFRNFPNFHIILPNITEFLRWHCYKEYGEAKCHPTDKFDEEFGKKLAKKRLIAKFNRMRSLYFRDVEHTINKYHRIISNKRVKYYKASKYDDQIYYNKGEV